MAPFALNHALVAADADTPTSWMLALHGIFGSGSNWRTFARRLTEARRDWGVALVDLRMHGKSLGASPPHTVDAAAEDLAELVTTLSREGRTVRAVCGHSFGGKVALAYRAGRAGPDLRQTWIIDASPSARPEAMDRRTQVVAVLAMLEELPAQWNSRDDFIAAVEQRGFSSMLARWLAMNLMRVETGYRLRFSLPALRELLADYFARDLWEGLEDPRAPGEVDVVVAGRSSAIAAADRRRLGDVANRSDGRVRVHVIADSGHWVHVEALEPLVALIGERLPRLS